MCDLWGKLPGVFCHTRRHAVNVSVNYWSTASLQISNNAVLLESPICLSQFYIQPKTPGYNLHENNVLSFGRPRHVLGGRTRGGLPRLGAGNVSS
jgi:hypothetical protein